MKMNTEEAPGHIARGGSSPRKTLQRNTSVDPQPDLGADSMENMPPSVIAGDHGEPSGGSAGRRSDEGTSSDAERGVERAGRRAHGRARWGKPLVIHQYTFSQLRDGTIVRSEWIW
jgi:hypothetical protein